MINRNCFYIRKIENEEDYKDLKLGQYNYSYFDLLDENNEIVDKYDYINIATPCRIDIENGLIRIYPKIGNEFLAYDEATHTIIDDKINFC